MNIYFEIDRLINFAIQKGLIEIKDDIYMANQIFDILNITGNSDINQIDEKLETATSILDNIAKFAIEKDIINDNSTEIDLFTTKIMGILVKRPSEIVEEFYKLYEIDKRLATDYFYKLSRDSNYIMVDRVNKNIEWDRQTKYGQYKLTINVSKPEKTVQEIERAKLVKSSGYPICLLCKENVGFSGNLNHPARQNLRTIPIVLADENWYIQYSPYVYYNEHSIVFNGEHTPMKISKNTFVKFISFLDKFPHYFVGSNADLPIVGGSILSHDHFQAGNYTMPMANASLKCSFKNNKYSSVKLSIVNWAMSVIRLRSINKAEIVEVANNILEGWRSYSAQSVGIISHTENTPHNTVTPIARINDMGEYEIDIVLRNNRKSEEHPDGIFHAHKEQHNVKKENIGLIEVMGLAVLPKRLIEEFEEIKKYLSSEVKEAFPEDNEHYDWVNYLIDKYGISNDEQQLEEIFQEEICIKFANCLVDCGVFKDDEIGFNEFSKFITTLGFIRI